MSAEADLEVEVLVVGAGFSGLGAAIALQRAGFEDWLIVEDGEGVGGTWFWNTYPGVAVDIPSFSYQFSYAQRADWSRTYAPGAELKRYAEWLVDQHGLRGRIRFGTRVVRAELAGDGASWSVTTDAGQRIRATYLLNASGVLTQPRLPDIPGVDAFGGTAMHTARWDHDVDLGGKRVAVIGTGASAIQVIPEIAPSVSELTVFQRTPIWCLPKPDVALAGWARRGLRIPGARRVARLASQAMVELTFPIAAHFHGWFPLATHVERLGRWWLGREVDDPETRSRLTPEYGLGCKRPSFHNGYLATFNAEHVHLVVDPILEVTPNGVRTADGVEHEVDVLVLATGFKVMERDNIPTYDLLGAEGRSLEQFWTDHRLQAYEGVAVPGFPNFFTVFGPYGYNGSSYFALIEAQTHHIVRCLREARRRGASRVEVTVEANGRFFGEMMRRRRRQVFWQESCAGANSYYFDANGDAPLRPTTTLESVWRSRRFDLADYTFGDPVRDSEDSPASLGSENPRTREAAAP